MGGGTILQLMDGPPKRFWGLISVSEAKTVEEARVVAASRVKKEAAVPIPDGVHAGKMVEARVGNKGSKPGTFEVFIIPTDSYDKAGGYSGKKLDVEVSKIELHNVISKSCMSCVCM